MQFFFLIAIFQILSRATSATSLFSFPLTKVGSRSFGITDSRDIVSESRVKRSALSNVSVNNLNFYQYVMDVGVGDPPSYYSLVIDTGSSITFIGYSYFHKSNRVSYGLSLVCHRTDKPYNRTSTSIATGQNLVVTYDVGYLAGPEYYDTMTLAPDIIISNQSIGDAVAYTDWPGVDGVLGVGPIGLTVGSLTPNITSLVPTVMDSARAQGLIQQQIMSVSFAPASTSNETNGIVTFGGVDSSLFIDNITYVPITSTYPAALSWGINATSCIYGETPIFPTSAAGIVDTGTSQVALASDFFAIYMNSIPGSYYDNQTGLLVIPSPSISNMQPLNFTIGGTVFTMDVAAQLIPVDQDYAWGGVPGVQYGTVGPLGSQSGQGLDFILGLKFLEKYYAVFDGENNRVGLAYTNHSTSPTPETSGTLSHAFGFPLLVALLMFTQAYILQIIP